MEEKVRGKKINRAIRIAYKKVEDPIQGRPPEEIKQSQEPL